MTPAASDSPTSPEAELIPPGSADVVPSDGPPPAPKDENLFLQVLLFQWRFARYLFRIAFSGDVRFTWKLKAFLAFVYVISPIDLIPEFPLGPLGLFDDLGLTLAVFDGVLNQVPRHVFDRCWSGGRRIVDQVKRFIGGSYDLIPGPIRKGLTGFLGSPGKPGLPDGGDSDSAG